MAVFLRSVLDRVFAVYSDGISVHYCVFLYYYIFKIDEVFIEALYKYADFGLCSSDHNQMCFSRGRLHKTCSCKNNWTEQGAFRHFF